MSVKIEEIELMRKELARLHAKLTVLESQLAKESSGLATKSSDDLVTNNLQSNRHYTPIVQSSKPKLSNSANPRDSRTLRSRSYKVMRHLINVVDESQVEHLETTLDRPFNRKLTQNMNLALSTQSITDAKTQSMTKSKLMSTKKPTVASKSPDNLKKINSAQPSALRHTVSCTHVQKTTLDAPPTVKITLEPFRLFSKEAQLYELAKSEFQGLCLPPDNQLESSYFFQLNRFKCSAENVKRRAYKLIKRGNAGLWKWDERNQTACYTALKKRDPNSQEALLRASFSGWATNKVEGSPPPLIKNLPAEISKNSPNFVWYWYKDRWLLFSLHRT
ncbi:hypothetical protein MJO29_016472 [Puccinia striiformis f. sp. tritici]|nr:hypothetical protein Pst134EB_028674 [Puccinia striiformis f. sp. tritici]KAI7934222.1 hypothetical protein MJO29_016472 [Puccinia striiformis f. sp. tritici]KAI9617826.1 hypothetical protein H4Q26_012690 [Puccinia striiformis f. sp. tritici PST-130]